MPILEKPYGWVWVAFAAWMLLRLVLVVVLAIVEARNLRLNDPKKMVWIQFATAAAFGFLAALGWRQFVDGPIVVVGCFSCVAWIAGFFVGFIFELILTIKVQHPIAVSIVAFGAASYADRLMNGEQPQRIEAATALGFIGSKALFATTQLLDSIKDRDPALRLAVTRAFLGIPAEDPAVDLAMVRGLSDADPNVRIWSACVLAGRGHKEAALLVPHLLAGSRMEETDTAGLCVEMLGKLGPDAAAAIPDLVQLLSAGTPMNYSASGALVQIGAIAVPSMVEKFKTLDTFEARLVVVQAFARMGTEAFEALPLLEKLQTHTDMMIRRTARKAIRKIHSANKTC
jgi:hypothetical protein